MDGIDFGRYGGRLGWRWRRVVVRALERDVRRCDKEGTVGAGEVAGFIRILEERKEPFWRWPGELREMVERHARVVAWLRDLSSQEVEVDRMLAEARSAVAGVRYGEADKLLEQVGEAELAAGEQGQVERRVRGADILAMRGRLARARREPDEAVRLYEQALAALPEGQGAREADWSVGLAGLCARVGEKEKAEALLGRAIELNEELGRKKKLADACYLLGWAHMDREGCGEAEGLFKRALGLFEKVDERDGAVACLASLGEVNEKRGELAEAERLYGEVLEASKRLDHLGGIGWCHYRLAAVLRAGNQWRAAGRASRRALRVCRRLGELERVLACYGWLGWVEQTRGRFFQAEWWYRRVIRLSRALGQGRRVAWAYGNLGRIYAKADFFWLASRLLRKTIRMYEEAGDRRGAADGYFRLGELCEKRRRWTEAERAYRRGRELSREVEWHEGVGCCAAGLGRVFLERGEMEDAEGACRESAEVFEGLRDREGAAWAYGQLGNVWLERGEPGLAKDWWVKARGIHEELGREEDARGVQAWIEGRDRRWWAERQKAWAAVSWAVGGLMGAGFVAGLVAIHLGWKREAWIALAAAVVLPFVLLPVKWGIWRWWRRCATRAVEP